MDANRSLSLVANEDGTVVVTNRHGTQITVDLHGKRGLTPLEMLLAALGSCSAVDIVELMRKQRDPVTPLAVDVEGLKDDQRMQWLRATYHVGADVDERKFERARSKTAEDLCTVSRTLTHGCPVDHVVG
ncbi:MAG TPA: OsmC family protein [Actinomycetota bacterium]|jgi:putative redox protein|nr:OsmC family protein [Actinomycetota bacterium]